MSREGSLTRGDWIQAALEALSRGGAANVRVDRLARELGITRGSFYWHFRDRADLLEAALSAWEEETRSLIGASKEEDAPEDRVLRLIELVKGLEGRLPDAAFFLWARQDEEVARRVAAVEAQRVDYVAGLLEEMGVPEGEARRRAEIAHLILVGLMDRISRDPGWRSDLGAILDEVAGILLGGAGEDAEQTSRESRNPKRRSP